MEPSCDTGGLPLLGALCRASVKVVRAVWALAATPLPAFTTPVYVEGGKKVMDESPEGEMAMPPLTTAVPPTMALAATMP